MSNAEGAARAAWVAWVGGLGVLAVLAAGAAILARSASAASLTGLAIVSGGVVATLLLGFPVREIARAVGAAVRSTPAPGERRLAALVWEAAARNAWVLSAVAAVAGFVSVLCSDFGSLSRFLSGVGGRAAGVALGLLFAIVFAIPALRLLPKVTPQPGAAPPPPWWQRALGGVSLVALLAWPLLGHVPGSSFAPASVLLNGPAWLITVGGALALALYLRTIGLGASVVVGLGAAGTMATLLGLTRSLQGFATVSIAEVAGGLMFAVSSGYAALAGLAAVGLPLLDGDAREGREPPTAARWSAYGFPIVVLAVLALAVLLVMIPMEKPAG
jgi:hypothetical protein